MIIKFKSNLPPQQITRDLHFCFVYDFSVFSEISKYPYIISIDYRVIRLLWEVKKIAKISKMPCISVMVMVRSANKIF